MKLAKILNIHPKIQELFCQTSKNVGSHTLVSTVLPSTFPNNHSFNLFLKELCHDILSHFFDGLNYSLSVGRPKNNALLRTKNTKRVILKQKGTRMAENGEN